MEENQSIPGGRLRVQHGRLAVPAHGVVGPPVGFRPAACGAVGAAVVCTAMSDVTRLLSAIEQGDPHAAAELLPLVYDELRRLAAQKMAQEAPGQTLQATALVHEAYIRLVGPADADRWENRGHFFAAAATA